MQNCGDAFRKFLVGRQATDKVIFIEIVRDIQIRNIDELVAVGEIVNDHYIVTTALRQSLNNITSNESGAAGYDMHRSTILRLPSCDIARHSTDTWPRLLLR